MTILLNKKNKMTLVTIIQLNKIKKKYLNKKLLFIYKRLIKLMIKNI